MRGPRYSRDDLRSLRDRAAQRRAQFVIPAHAAKDRPAMKDLTQLAPVAPQEQGATSGDWVRIRRRAKDASADVRPAPAPAPARAADASEKIRDFGPVALVPRVADYGVMEDHDARRGAPQPDVWDSLARIRGERGLTALALSADIYNAEPLTQGFDLLRTRLMQTMRSNGWRRVAVATPRPGGGATFTAVNLALSLAKVPGSRTVLMDLNQRTPGVAAALGLRQTGSIHEFLSGEVALEDHLVRASDTLVLGMTDKPFAQAAEVFHDPTAELVLEDMYEALNPDLVIYDLPPALVYDDLAAVMPLVDGVLLVSDGTDTTAEDIAACERILEAQVPLLGVVLNRARTSEHRNKWF